MLDIQTWRNIHGWTRALSQPDAVAELSRCRRWAGNIVRNGIGRAGGRWASPILSLHRSGNLHGYGRSIERLRHDQVGIARFIEDGLQSGAINFQVNVVFARNY